MVKNAVDFTVSFVTVIRIKKRNTTNNKIDKITQVEHKITQIKHKMTQVEHKMAQVEHKMAQVEHKMTQVEHKMMDGMFRNL